eukprot:g3077.t1
MLARATSPKFPKLNEDYGESETTATTALRTKTFIPPMEDNKKNKKIQTRQVSLQIVKRMNVRGKGVKSCGTRGRPVTAPPPRLVASRKISCSNNQVYEDLKTQNSKLKEDIHHLKQCLLRYSKSSVSNAGGYMTRMVRNNMKSSKIRRLVGENMKLREELARAQNQMNVLRIHLDKSRIEAKKREKIFQRRFDSLRKKQLELKEKAQHVRKHAKEVQENKFHITSHASAGTHARTIETLRQMFEAQRRGLVMARSIIYKYDPSALDGLDQEIARSASLSTFKDAQLLRYGSGATSVGTGLLPLDSDATGEKTKTLNKSKQKSFGRDVDDEQSLKSARGEPVCVAATSSDLEREVQRLREKVARLENSSPTEASWGAGTDPKADPTTLSSSGLAKSNESFNLRDQFEAKLEDAKKKLVESTVKSLLRVCVVAPSVSLQMEDKRRDFKAAFPMERVKTLLSERILPKYTNLYEQIAEHKAPDGSDLDEWVEDMLRAMYKRMIKHLKPLFDEAGLSVKKISFDW